MKLKRLIIIQMQTRHLGSSFDVTN